VTTPDQSDRFYIAVRRDLAPGPQLAQAVHAAIQFTQEWPDLVVPWYTESNFLVVVSLADEDALMDLADQAKELGVRYSITQEPDYGEAWTAVALEPGETARLLCACEALALKEAEEPKLEDSYN
jgi:peptidyl-tRNA hydrolase